MPQVALILYREKDGQVPLRDWLQTLPDKVVAKCLVRLERLRDLGHELRRPEADYLRDDIYELRVKMGTINYRMLYFFHGEKAVVVSHGLMKEKRVPPAEIELAKKRKDRFDGDPPAHTHSEG